MDRLPTFGPSLENWLFDFPLILSRTEIALTRAGSEAWYINNWLISVLGLFLGLLMPSFKEQTFNSDGHSTYSLFLLMSTTLSKHYSVTQCLRISYFTNVYRLAQIL